MDEEHLNHFHTRALCDRGVRDLSEWLEQHENITLVRHVDDNTVDFTIGDFEDDWPSRMEGFPVIRGSSITTSYGPAWADDESWENHRFVDEGTIHLPPTHEFRRDVIEERLESLGEQFFVHFGTTNQMAGFGAINDAPDGVVTPHLMVAKDCTFKDVRVAVETCLALYESNVYDEGDNVLLEAP